MIEASSLPTDLSKRVHDMIREYVEQRTKRRSGITWSDFKDHRVKDESGRERIDIPADYREARVKVCEGAFLAVRACKSRQDFVTFFTGTICAEPQRLPIADFQQLSAALLSDDDRWEQIKALSMLALSGLSYV